MHIRKFIFTLQGSVCISMLSEVISVLKLKQNIIFLCNMVVLKRFGSATVQGKILMESITF